MSLPVKRDALETFAKTKPESETAENPYAV
jgi:hypothetical protein